MDLLVQVELTDEYEHSPIVTADNTLTLLKKETGTGLISCSKPLERPITTEWLHWPQSLQIHTIVDL